MAADALRCWSCGSSLAAVPLPFGRRSECPHCEVFLHTCRQCDFYDPGVSKSCRETTADEVADKEQANFCDHFRPRAGLSGGADSGAAAARAKLAALFGGKPDARPRPAAPQVDPRDVEAEAARQKLESLFGKPKN